MSDFLSEDPLQDPSTEAVSLAINKVDAHLENYPESNVNSLKKIAKHIPDKTFKKGGSRRVSKCHKVKACYPLCATFLLPWRQLEHTFMLVALS